ncbi:hypothetical protein AAF712_016904, partial [Marasmius tenuissimus]
GPTVSDYGPTKPYLLTYGETSGKDNKWKKPRSAVSLRVVIAADEYDQFDTALQEHTEQVERAESGFHPEEHNAGQNFPSVKSKETVITGDDVGNDSHSANNAITNSRMPSPPQANHTQKRTRSVGICLLFNPASNDVIR